MYLDTDILLALIKKEDWLKEYIDIKKLKNPVTSVLNIIEARIVLYREYSRQEAVYALGKIKELRIKIISIDSKTVEKSQDLIERYPRLNMFDAVHAACVIINKEEFISTDTIFDDIDKIIKIDPRRRGTP